MKICVLQPSYERSDMLQDYAQHDPPRDLSHLAPEWSFTHAFLHKATVYNQLKELKKRNFDIFVNLCEGHLEWDVPSIDVIYALESLELPYSGPTPKLYEPRKESLKVVAHYAGVRTPRHVTARSVADVERAGRRLRFPLFVKPNEGGDSFGIDKSSLCHDVHQLAVKSESLLDTYEAILIEEYVAGREYSVLVAANPAEPKKPAAWPPVEFRFPEGEKFKTYDLKNMQFLPELNIRVADSRLEAELIDAARQIFVGYGGAGYCRMDFRLDQDGAPNVLDANFTCSVFYPDGYFGTADYILRLHPEGPAGFLRHIVADGLARHKSRQSLMKIRNDSLVGFGSEAARAIARGEIVYRGEERAQRIATRRWIENNWDAADQTTFAHYGCPIDDEVSILWSEDPMDWAPQNHSCDPNCAYDGLNVVALRDIPAGEELTLDYAGYCNESAQAFVCKCGASGCRGYVKGTPGNSIAVRERRKRIVCIAAK